MQIDAQVVEDEMNRLFDICKRIESFDMDENVRISISNDIKNVIDIIRQHFDLTP